jgi:hypothetical protein
VLASVVALTLAPAARGADGEESADGAAPAPSSALQLALFVDAYATWQTADEGTLATLSNHRMFSGQGANLRAENGFSLAFLGLDARYDAGIIGGVASLRFGAPDGSARYCLGAAVIADYRLTDHFGVGARGESVRDDASYGDADVWQLVTGTITLGVLLTPLPATDDSAGPLLVLRWENTAPRGADAWLPRGSPDSEDGPPVSRSRGVVTPDPVPEQRFTQFCRCAAARARSDQGTHAPVAWHELLN